MKNFFPKVLGPKVLAPVLLILVTACSMERPSSDVPKTTDERQGQTHFIDGIPAGDFYRKLSYTREANNQHRYLTTDGWIYASREYQGDLYFRVWLFLHDDRKYELVYEEVLGYYDTEGFKIHQPIFKQTYSGKYAIHETELILPRLARGIGAVSGGRSLMNFELLSNLNTPEMAGFTVRLNLVSSASSPNEIMKDYIDLGQFKWLNGEWEVKDRPFRFEFSSEKRRFAIEKFEGVVNSNGIPLTCHYRITSDSVVANFRSDPLGLKQEIRFMPKEYKLLSHENNSRGCAQYIEQENARLPTRTWPEYFFLVKLSDKTVSGSDGQMYKKK